MTKAPKDKAETVREAFNMAMKFALDWDTDEGLEFLRLWREGAWPEIREEWPEFDVDTAIALDRASRPDAGHPDDVAVDNFAAAMKVRLAQRRANGYGGWEYKAACSQPLLSGLLHAHVKKGDPVDIANFAMTLHHRGESVLPVQSADQASDTIEPTMEASREWWVFSTAVADCVLMLECRNTGAFGIVRNPTKAEWAAAFHAPTRPYRWTGGDDRVEATGFATDTPPPKGRGKLHGGAG